MLAVAAKKLKTAEGERDDIKEELSAAKDEISGNKKTIADLQKKIQSEKDKDKKEEILDEIDEINIDVKTAQSEHDDLTKKLNAKDQEIKKYDVGKK